MKPLVLAFLLCLSALPARAGTWAEDYAALLKKYVSFSGVHYAAWKADAADVQTLAHVVDSFAAAPDTDLAFYLNAYNACVLQGVLAHYPIKSTEELPREFFSEPRLTIGGRKMSLDDLEKEITGPRFHEARAPFALCKASRGSPKITAQFVRPASLTTMLTLLTGWFINDENNVRVSGGTVELAPLFEDHRDSFAPGGPAAFINTYRTHHVDEDLKVAYRKTFDHTLNEAK